MTDRAWDLAVLDMAGTTIADEGIVAASVAAALAEVAPDRTVDRDALTSMRGGSKQEMFEVLAPEDPQRAVSAFHESLLRMVGEGRVQPIPGAVDAIRSLQGAGIAVCFTTGFARSLVDAILDRLGWHDLPDDVVTAAEAGRGRPHPDLVLTAALRAGVSAMSRVVVCGDTVNDLRSGANAGAGLLVGVLTGAHDRAALEAVPRSLVVPSVAALPSLLTEPAGSLATFP